MPKPLKCSFCKNDFPFGTGLMYVKVDGTILWFCSKRCRRSLLDFHRSPSKVKWVVRRKK